MAMGACGIVLQSIFEQDEMMSAERASARREGGGGRGLVVQVVVAGVDLLCAAAGFCCPPVAGVAPGAGALVGRVVQQSRQGSGEKNQREKQVSHGMAPVTRVGGFTIA